MNQLSNSISDFERAVALYEAERKKLFETLDALDKAIQEAKELLANERSAG